MVVDRPRNRRDYARVVRYHLARLRRGDPSDRPWRVEATYGGTRVRFYVSNRVEWNRATHLDGQRAVVRWLFDDTDGKTVWDIGAYQGHYTCIALRKGASVVAFEPVEENRDRLRANLALNDGYRLVEGIGFCGDARRVDLENSPDVHVNAHALGAARGTVPVAGRGGPQPEMARADGGTDVEVLPGDAVEPAPDIVKVDVGGHEVAVLDGMAETLRTVERIVVAVHAPADVERVVSHLREAGLDVAAIDSDRAERHVGGWRR